MFVCLWSPAWRTVADSLADLSPALLTVTPRVVTEERRGGLVWVDVRGLDAEHVARSAVEVLRGLGLSNVQVGMGKTAVSAEIWAVATREGEQQAGRWSQVLVAGRPASGGHDEHPEALDQRPAPATSDQPALPSSHFPLPESLGSLPISIL